MLDKIDDFLITADRMESLSLWDVLTALRGPDDEDRDLKDVTTAVIRAKAFPKAGRHKVVGGTCLPLPLENIAAFNYTRDTIPGPDYSHFGFHINNARIALNIPFSGPSWEES
jgi:hypothetical protein